MYNWAKKALPRNFFPLLSYNVFCIPFIVLGPFSIIILKLLAYSEVHQLFFYYYYLFLKAHGLYYRLGFRRNKLYCLVTNLTIHLVYSCWVVCILTCCILIYFLVWWYHICGLMFTVWYSLCHLTYNIT